MWCWGQGALLVPVQKEGERHGEAEGVSEYTGVEQRARAGLELLSSNIIQLKPRISICQVLHEENTEDGDGGWELNQGMF